MNGRHGLTRRAWLRLTCGGVLGRALQVPQPAPAWTALFDGAALGDWEQTSFGGEGPVRVQDGAIILEMGDPLTGITWAGPALPPAFEIELEAARWAGNDFFCGLTFPVAQSSCSLILGGWGGTTVGLSTLDGRDASENETTRDIRFEDRRWYRVRLAVTSSQIQAWLDDQLIVEVALAGRRVGIRPEVDPSRPLGVACYRTRAALRGLRFRRL